MTDLHPHQTTVEEWTALIKDHVRMVMNRPDCSSSRRIPKLIWVGTPSYPPRWHEPKPIVDPPVEGTCASTSFAPLADAGRV